MKELAEQESDQYRYKIMQPIGLIIDLKKYEAEKNKIEYKQVQDFLWYIEHSLDQFPNLKALLWTLESRNIRGKYHGIVKEEVVREQAKIVSMFLKLAYW